MNYNVYRGDDMNEDYLTIGELAQKMDVTVRTLQYYDREGLLKPAAISKGGRRLYSTKDIVKLHQILSFKYLGFSLVEIKTKLFNLDTPQEVAAILNQQKSVIQEQIANLSEALEATIALSREVQEMNTVDFKKYAEIIELLRLGNKEYWVWKHFDNTITDHIKERFGDDPEAGLRIFSTYQEVLDKLYVLKKQGVSPDSPECFMIAKQWWEMILEFTGGNLELLPELQKFNDKKDDWNNDLAVKQKEVDNYLTAALEYYFKRIQKEQGRYRKRRMHCRSIILVRLMVNIRF